MKVRVRKNFGFSPLGVAENLDTLQGYLPPLVGLNELAPKPLSQSFLSLWGHASACSYDYLNTNPSFDLRPSGISIVIAYVAGLRLCALRL